MVSLNLARNVHVAGALIVGGYSQPARTFGVTPSAIASATAFSSVGFAIAVSYAEIDVRETPAFSASSSCDMLLRFRSARRFAANSSFEYSNSYSPPLKNSHLEQLIKTITRISYIATRKVRNLNIFFGIW